MPVSISQLPELFQENMKQLIGPEAFQAYLDSFEKEWFHGLRGNSLKLSAKELQTLVTEASEAKADLKQVPWISNGFYYDASWQAAKDPMYYAGLYYLQEPSAMTPAHLLPVVPGDRVLDLCAAPGGKSTELGAKLQGQGMLFANDISNSRAKALLKNLELFGIPNFCVTSETPEKLQTVFPEFFDKILVDAPCSGEGMFRRDPDMIKSWRDKGPDYYGPVQRQILTSAAAMLKQGGLLMYSTCTFAKEEDEDNICWLLSEHPELELVKLPDFEGAVRGFGLLEALRLFPHKLNGEGHFLALIHKKGESCAAEPGRKMSASDLGDFPDFMKACTLKAEPDRLSRFNDQLYLLPEGFPTEKKLRYLRSGLLLGTFKKDRFEPSQAFAMVLKPEQFSCCLKLSPSDDRVKRYLKGETVSLYETDQVAAAKGWILVCLETYPLGWAKIAGMTLKNKYYPGWRMQ